MLLKSHKCIYAGGGKKSVYKSKKSRGYSFLCRTVCQNPYQHNLYSNYASTAGAERIRTLSVGLFCRFLFEFIEFGL